MSRTRLACLLCAFLLATSALTGQDNAGKKASDEEIARLIEQLGSKDYKIREAATGRLKGLDEALPALRRALKSPANEEMRQRAEAVSAVIESRLAEAFIRQTVARVN